MKCVACWKAVPACDGAQDVLVQAELLDRQTRGLDLPFAERSSLGAAARRRRSHEYRTDAHDQTARRIFEYRDRRRAAAA